MSHKLLCLMRHSMAVPTLTDTIKNDFDKPLTDEGIQVLKKAAEYLRTEKFKPDAVYCSAAVRTRQTLDWLQESLGKQVEINLTEDLYGIKASGLIEAIKSFPESQNSVLVIGHNPSISEVTGWLYQKLEVIEQGEVLNLPLKPCQLVIFKISDAAWADIESAFISEARLFSPSLASIS